MSHRKTYKKTKLGIEKYNMIHAYYIHMTKFLVELSMHEIETVKIKMFKKSMVEITITYKLVLVKHVFFLINYLITTKIIFELD